MFFIFTIKVNALEDGIYTIHSSLDKNYVLDVTDCKASSSTKIQLYSFSNIDAQRFYIKKNPNAQEELRLLKILWGCVDKDTKHIYDLPSKYGPKHGTVNAYSLYGSLYGELGRWPTELQTNVGSDKASSHLLNCPMESIPGIESVSGKLRLVE